MSHLRARACLVAWGCVALAALPRCAADPREGYSFSPTFDTQVRTVAVPVFENTTYDTDIEADLTRAIVDEILLRTPWRIGQPSRADTTLTGSIRESDLGALSIRRQGGLVQEQAYFLTIDYRWTDNRSGDLLASRQGLRATSSFVPATGVGEQIAVGRERAIRELATEIVSTMRSAW